MDDLRKRQRREELAAGILLRYVQPVFRRDLSSPVTLSKNRLDQADVLTATFFDRPAEKVAHDLIGCRLHWKEDDRPHSRVITETEAYTGPDDLASHASKGRTQRNEAMFGPPGTFYEYFVYGLHWMLNVVTGPIDYPAAV